MIAYLITSTLLSVIGWGLYHLLLRRWGTPAQQRKALHVLLLGSLLLPILVPTHLQPSLSPSPRVAPLRFGARLDHGALKQYCRCESPDYTHRIRYRANGHYNFLLSHKIWLSYAVLTAITLVLLLFIGQIGYLYWLTKHSEADDMRLGNKAFTLLTPPCELGIGAFWLGRAYVIWQEPLSLLSPMEREAIYVHELSHLQQGNTIEKALLRLIQCLWWFNPVFYLIRRELELLSEFIADHQASRYMGGAKPYANLLLTIKLHQQRLSNGMSALTGGVLRLRIEQLVQPKPARPRLAWAAVGLVCLLQISIVSPLAARVDDTLFQLRTYEEIYQHAPTAPEVLYCPDCETVCTPE